MKPGKAICVALLACVLAPASAAASTVQVTGAGELRFDGAGDESNRVIVRYKLAKEAGFNSVSDRFVVEDSGPIQSGSAGCVPFENTKISCDARPVSSIDISLGDGDDVLTITTRKDDHVAGRYPTLARGGDGNDVIRGGDADDRLYGEGGQDVVAGWLGDDLLSGGPGNDSLVGFEGDDTLLGGAGGDVLFAQKGHDRLLGESGRDLLQADDGQRDPVINCGPGGAQTALTDRRDPKPRRCGSPARKRS